jgi:hypothetical protein
LKRFFITSSIVAVITVLAFTTAGSLQRVAAAEAKVEAIRVQGPGTQPQIFFACCDQGLSDMESWVSNPLVISQLQALHAGLAVEISDFTPERAQAVRKLNEAGIPLTAWLVMSREQGHYLNGLNAPEAEERFTQFEQWTKENGLKWGAVGLDIEPNFDQLKEAGRHKGSFLWLMIKRFFDYGQVERGRKAYAGLIQRIRAAGYPVQTYQMPFLAEERAVHSTLIERLFGIVDARSDDEVLMAYSSFNHAAGGGIPLIYGRQSKGGPQTQTLAVGTTLDDKAAGLTALSWEEFSRDLIVAGHFSHVVGVYSLEGCIRQSYLPRMALLDWSQTVTIPADQVAAAQTFDKHLRHAIWIFSRLPYVVIALLVVAVTFAWWLMRRRSARHEALLLLGGGNLRPL